MNGGLYLLAQRLRGGVTPGLIRQAAARLDQSATDWREYLARRLETQFGPGAGAPDWLPAQPLVTRTDLMAPHAEAIAAGPARGREVRRTSGSTGTPFRFAKSVEMTAWMDATMWALYRWHGVAPGDRQLRFWGMPLSTRDRARKRLIDWVSGRIRYDAFTQSPDAAGRFLARARRFRPRYAYGYPTLMAAFAADCTARGESGRDLELRAVITTGEILQPAHRAQLEAFFGCRVVNEYGCTEAGILAFGCEEGTTHLTPVAALPEVVDPDGRPSPAGTEGEVVVTDLYGALLPLRRYRLHDRATTGPADDCRCGRALPRLALSVGRQDGFIRTPSGRQVYDAILAYSVPEPVQRFRARQVALDRIEVDLVPRAGADPASTARAAEQAWRTALQGELEFRATVVDDLPFDVSGKLRYFVPLPETGESPPVPGP